MPDSIDKNTICKNQRTGVLCFGTSGALLAGFKWKTLLGPERNWKTINQAECNDIGKKGKSAHDRRAHFRTRALVVTSFPCAGCQPIRRQNH